MSSFGQKGKPQQKAGVTYILGGLFFIGIGLVVIFYSFQPVVKEELHYQLVTKKTQSAPVNNPIVPVNTEFGIVIPKLAANAPVIAEVDPFNEQEYQLKLTKGIAHAKGSSFPGDTGRIFLFAHSAGDFYEANRYNAIFYLLYKLQPRDEIKVYYQGKEFIYKVKELKYISDENVEEIYSDSETDLVLMTCWPPGTSYKRLLVIAE